MNNIYNLKVTIPKIELVKNNYYDISINCDNIVKSSDKQNNSSDLCIININSSDEESDNKRILEINSSDTYAINSFDEDKKIIKKRKLKKSKCPGCYPIYQPNQLGHIGQNGCLGDEY
jgi:hypothetical protein